MGIERKREARMSESNLESILELRHAGQNTEAQRLLLELCATNPNDARVQYETACVHDVLGQEAQSVAYYVKAIDLGLPRDLLREAYLGLGSTYRALGQYEQAKEILEQATQISPDANELKVFHAMTLYNLGLSKQAVATLLGVLTKTTQDTHVAQYAKAIDEYAQDLDKKWL